MREEFEKLPEIRDSISEHIVFIGNKYTTPNPDFYDLVNWLNGAWYAFQEQQKSHQQETACLKTQLLAAEAEISRLHSGFDGLKQYAVNCINRDGLESAEWEDGYLFASVRFLKEINRITGADK